MAPYGSRSTWILAVMLLCIVVSSPAVAADCGADSGITARDLTIVDIKPDGKPKIDAGAFFKNAAVGNKKALAALHRCAENRDAEAMALLGMYYSERDETKSMD